MLTITIIVLFILLVIWSYFYEEFIYKHDLEWVAPTGKVFLIFLIVVWAVFRLDATTINEQVAAAEERYNVCMENQTSVNELIINGSNLDLNPSTNIKTINECQEYFDRYSKNKVGKVLYDKMLLFTGSDQDD